MGDLEARYGTSKIVFRFTKTNQWFFIVFFQYSPSCKASDQCTFYAFSYCSLNLRKVMSSCRGKNLKKQAHGVKKQ